jgi:ribosomal protein S18 acetylase RimI-like enzyme
MSDMAEIHRVAGAADIAVVAVLARQIWEHQYIPIIGREQTEYMIDRFQSGPAIARQIASGYEYYLVTDAGLPTGYFAIVHSPEEGSALLSKIYVHPERQGRGIGRRIIAFVEDRCLGMGLGELWLTVNRHNAGSIAFYERVGFMKRSELVQDIGNGFVMDDFKMVKMIYGRPVFS